MRLGAACVAVGALLCASAPASADRPLAKRTLDLQRFVQGPCGGTGQTIIRLPRRTARARVLRPRVGSRFRELITPSASAIVTSVTVNRRRTVIELVGDCAGDRYLEEEGWEVELRPFIRYQRRERIFVTSHLGTRVRPRVMTVGASQQFLNLRWRNWGQRVARARGVIPFNDCKPYCAEGTITNRPLRVTLSRPRMCAGRLQYMRVTYRVARGPRQWFSTRYVC